MSQTPFYYADSWDFFSKRDLNMHFLQACILVMCITETRFRILYKRWGFFLSVWFSVDNVQRQHMLLPERILVGFQIA